MRLTCQWMSQVHRQLQQSSKILARRLLLCLAVMRAAGTQASQQLAFHTAQKAARQGRQSKQTWGNMAMERRTTPASQCPRTYPLCYGASPSAHTMCVPRYHGQTEVTHALLVLACGSASQQEHACQKLPSSHAVAEGQLPLKISSHDQVMIIGHVFGRPGTLRAAFMLCMLLAMSGEFSAIVI